MIRLTGRWSPREGGSSMSTRTRAADSPLVRTGAALVLAIGATATGASAMAAPRVAEPGTPAALTNTCSPPPPPAPSNSGPTSGPGVRKQVRPASLAVRGADPVQECHHGAGPASGDPNQNTDPQYSDLLGPASDSTRCSSTCQVSIDLSDAQFDLTATSQGGGASAVEVDSAGPRCCSPRATAAVISQPAPATAAPSWTGRSSASPTRRRVVVSARPRPLRCVARPPVPTRRPGRRSSRSAWKRRTDLPPGLGSPSPGSDGIFDGVLPDCAGAAVRGPCVVSRLAVQDNGGRWHTRIVFTMPPNAKDPKALG